SSSGATRASPRPARAARRVSRHRAAAGPDRAGAAATARLAGRGPRAHLGGWRAGRARTLAGHGSAADRAMAGRAGDAAGRSGGARFVARQAGLEVLDLTDTAAGDRAAAAIGGLARLHGLALAGSAITDAGAIALASAHTIEVLDLARTAVGPTAAPALAALP